MKGFSTRIWGAKFNKTIVKPSGMFIVRFHFVLETDDVLKQDFVDFDKKPFITKKWAIRQSVDKKETQHKTKTRFQMDMSEQHSTNIDVEGQQVNTILDIVNEVDNLTQQDLGQCNTPKEDANKALKVAAAQKYFRHHPACHGLKQSVLSHADDLPLFNQTDIQCVKFLMIAFKYFHNCSSLDATIGKSQLMAVGVIDETKGRLLALTGFQFGVLPFKYLGVAEKPQRMSKLNCQTTLVDRIPERIRALLAQELTYAGK
ncbi:hypothetical protein Cgig2_027191 [Carnegiea gigantea]|uniref:Uncharacterized protein n=1 Tax=Carnegiea gigantea TaxID=171969 RepID=A0A9Q1QPB9_9CARY|nr:hypothetical protein Cgig2_027191 [Carnegiea gigantea]